MFEKLERIEKKLAETEEKLSSPDVASDMQAYTALMKEYKQLLPVAEKYREYKKALADKEDYALLMDSADDADMKEEARAEYAAAEEACEKCREELKIMLLPKDPNDDKDVIIEIRAGAGGDEACLFAGVLYRMYNMYAEQRGYKCELLYANETELGGIKEISFTVSGEGAYSRFKFESGVHRVQRVPETESQGRIQTSTATVAVLPEVEDVDFQLNMDELEITTHRSSGAGGQHINKTESAIRIVHIPTGTVVDCQDERSQGKNKDKALKVMKSRLAALEREKRESAIASERRSQVGTGDRSERIRTYNYPQGRVTDHRIGLTLYSIESFVNGKLDDMIDALITADRAAKLASSGEND
ncbi:MAG: peptide chain release factor 1 [Clostridia bacterium]|nr:peptide chain release factor 1 [Clostridia bacterium]MBO7549244.1 peptide chain release factor 1 [Clostridia bacterium]